MPFSEIANALFLTYVGTEYHHVVMKKKKQSVSQFIQSFLYQKKNNQMMFLSIIAINLLDRFMGISLIMLQQGLEQLWHAPKILLVAILYVTFLYYDCSSYLSPRQDLSVKKFIRLVGFSFLKILPLYPVMAVLITIFFEVFSEFLEAVLHVDDTWLNVPIYYGVLYGPFSMVYFQVKRLVVFEEEDSFYSLPMTTKTTKTTLSSCCNEKKTEKEDDEIVYQESDYFNPNVEPLPQDFVPRNYG